MTDRMSNNIELKSSALNLVGSLKAMLLHGLHHFCFIFAGASFSFGYFYYYRMYS